MQDIGIALLIIAALELLSGIYIFVTRVKGHLVYAHSLVVFGVVIWVMSNGMYKLTTSISIAEFWTKMYYLGAVLLTIGFAYFTYAFPFLLKKLSWPVITILIASAIYFGAIVIFTGDIAHAISSGGNILLKYGSLNQVFIVWFHAMFFWGFANLVEKMKLTTGYQRRQIRYIFVGVLLSFIFGDIFALLLPALGGPQWFFIACGSSIFWLTFVMYIVFNKKAR